MNLTNDEAADLLSILYDYRLDRTTTSEVLTHVTELAAAYRAQGYVMGDLAHDGTLKAQSAAEEQ